MSFNDLERGFGPNNSSSRGRGPQFSLAGGGEEERQYRALSKTISQQVFNITSNVASIQRLLGLLGTSKDTPDVRDKLHTITDSTRDLVKDTSNDIKTLNQMETGDEAKTRQRKIEQQKLSKDFQKVLADFQKAQRLSAEKQREYVDRAKASNVRNDVYGDMENEEEQPLFFNNNNSRRMQLQVVDNEIEYNESLIAEREDEIREIEQGITELNEIFRDLGTLVNEQQSSIDNIETNVTSISANVRTAADELSTASRYQKNARNKMCCLLLIFVVIGLIVSLGVLVH